MVAPVFEQLSDEYKGKIDFVKIDVDKEQKLAAKYNISSIPTLVVFKSGKIVESKLGAATKDTKQLIEKYKN